MIFVVILIAAATTIIAASVDLGRMAIYKQKQSEREAKWQYCVESSNAFVVEDLIDLVGTTESFSKTINGIDLSISTAPAGGWNSGTSTQMAVTGTIEGKSKTTKQYIGKRATVQAPRFALFFTDKYLPDAAVVTSGDAYLANTIDCSNLNLSGDLYSPYSTQPAVAALSGTFIGRQPGQTIVLDDSAYQAAASITTSGNSTLTNPTNLLSLTTSQLRYHSGALTITGTTTGEITIFVKGSVTIKSPSNAVLGILGRLVVICDGDVQIDTGTSEVFLICNGKITSTGAGGNRTINGSIAGKELSGTGFKYTVNFDNYFNANSDGGNRYWLPGQW